MASTIQCKAAVAWGPSEPLKVETIEVSPPEPGEVRIRLSVASLCHTDIEVLNGVNLGLIKPQFPIIVGHESAGVVESIGDGVTSVKPGDSVIPINMPQCRRCKLCLSHKTCSCLVFDENFGHGYLDKNRTTRFRCRGQVVHHCIGVSSLTEYTVCREEFVAKINPAAEHDKVCILGCGFLTGYGAALNNAKVEPGSICGIFGVGSVGLSAVFGCKTAGAKTIIAIDINESKFPLARHFGATHCLNPKSKGFAEELMGITGGDGLDYAIECAGDMSAMSQAISMTNKYWGVTTIVGASPVDAEFHVGNAVQFLGGRILNGSWMGGFKGRDSIPKLVEEYLAGKLPLADFYTHRLRGLEEINDGFALMKSKDKCVGKVVVNLK